MVHILLAHHPIWALVASPHAPSPRAPIHKASKKRWWYRPSAPLLFGIVAAFIIIGALPYHQGYGVTLSGIAIGLGPVSTGNGGGGPPGTQTVHYQLTYDFWEDRELNISFIPGISYSWRKDYRKAYLALGPGLVLSYKGLGLGGIMGMGYHILCYYVCLALDFRKALGFTLISTEESGVEFISSYSLRFTLGVRF